MSTPQYVKDAQNAYNAKFDLVQLKLPKGTKERIRAVFGDDISITRYCVQSVLVALENDEDFEKNNIPVKNVHDAEISQKPTKTEQNTKEPEKQEDKPFTDSQEDFS